jgi:hypothetical protein
MLRQRLAALRPRRQTTPKRSPATRAHVKREIGNPKSGIRNPKSETTLKAATAHKSQTGESGFGVFLIRVSDLFRYSYFELRISGPTRRTAAIMAVSNAPRAN